MPRSGIAGSSDSIMSNFLSNHQTDFQSGCTSFQSHQQLGSVPLSPHPCQHLLSHEFLILAILTGVRFSCNSLRDFCVSSSRASSCLPVFFYISLRELFISLKPSITILRSDFRSESCFSGVMVYPGLVMVRELGSDDAK